MTNKAKVTTFAAICVFLSLTGASAQTAMVREIDEHCRSVDAFTKGSPALVFGDVTDQENDQAARWRRFASEKALDKFRQKQEVYNIAKAWRRNGKVVSTLTTLSSPSGDWAKYVHAYYREDGTLAKAAIDFRTFMGDVQVSEDLYFDRSGKMIKKTSKIEDLTTHKLKRTDKDNFDKGPLNRVDHYMTVAKLPYASLLKK